MTAAGSFRPELLAPLLQELGAQGRCGEIPIRGTSMSPTLLPGDRLRVVPATANDVRAGDLVIWVGQAGPIAHRLVGWWKTRAGWRLLTKGDHAPRLDPPVPGHCLVARAVARVRADEVQELDEARVRLCGRGRAAASLAVGIIVEVWDRARQATRRGAGWPGC
jgi:signal peptidase